MVGEQHIGAVALGEVAPDGSGPEVKRAVSVNAHVAEVVGHCAPLSQQTDGGKVRREAIPFGPIVPVRQDWRDSVRRRQLAKRLVEPAAMSDLHGVPQALLVDDGLEGPGCGSKPFWAGRLPAIRHPRRRDPGGGRVDLLRSGLSAVAGQAIAGRRARRIEGSDPIRVAPARGSNQQLCCGHRPLRRPIAGASSPETTPLGGGLSRGFGGGEHAGRSAEESGRAILPVLPAEWRGEGGRVRGYAACRGSSTKVT